VTCSAWYPFDNWAQWTETPFRHSGT